MFKKFAIIGISALVLGGCSLIGNKEAAEDVASKTTEPAVSTMPKASVQPQSDPELEQMATTSTSADTESIEKDLKNTTILKEDFSDIK